VAARDDSRIPYPAGCCDLDQSPHGAVGRERGMANGAEAYLRMWARAEAAARR